MIPTPEQDAALAAAFAEKEAADIAAQQATVKLNQMLGFYQKLAGVKPGNYALKADTNLILTVMADGKVGIDRLPIFGASLKGA